MKRLTMLTLAALVLAACQEATQPEAVYPISTVQFSAALEITATDLGTLGGTQQPGPGHQQQRPCGGS